MGVYERLGVRPIINACGMTTVAGGSLMPRPVLDAMAEAAMAFVDMHQLHAKAGEQIAELIGVEGAHVTSGSAGGLLLAAAACMAGSDPVRVKQLPDTTGMRNEIIIQKCQRFQYDQALRLAGATLIEVGTAAECTPAEIEARIGDRTAALIFVVSTSLGSRGVTIEEIAALAKRHNIPLIVDAASTLPPSSHLTRWTDKGADLVIFSGGKGIRGPQGSGLLLGRRDLIQAAAANGAPNASVGRPSKVSKEDIVGLVTALEIFLKADHPDEWDRHAKEARHMADAVEGLPGVSVRIEDDDAIWTAPTVLVELDEQITALTPAGVRKSLLEGEPPIMARVMRQWLLIDPHCMYGDDYQVVARRLREELARVPAAATA
jgi:uncharacterized pyridoxal phosphate-dependent enzyme